MIINAHNFPGPAGIAAVVNSLFAFTGNGGTSTSLNTTGSNLIVVGVSKAFAGGATSLSDNQSNTYTALTEKVQGTVEKMQLFYCAGPTVGASHTWTCSTTSGAPTIFVGAFSGAHASPFDLENGAVTNGTSLSTGSITPTQNGSLVVSGIGIFNLFSALGVSASLSILSQNSRLNLAGGGFATLIQTTAAAINPGWSWTSNRHAAAVIASFKPA